MMIAVPGGVEEDGFAGHAVGCGQGDVGDGHSGSARHLAYHPPFQALTEVFGVAEGIARSGNLGVMLGFIGRRSSRGNVR